MLGEAAIGDAGDQRGSAGERATLLTARTAHFGPSSRDAISRPLGRIRRERYGAPDHTHNAGSRAGGNGSQSRVIERFPLAARYRAPRPKNIAGYELVSAAGGSVDMRARRPVQASAHRVWRGMVSSSSRCGRCLVRVRRCGRGVPRRCLRRSRCQPGCRLRS